MFFRTYAVIFFFAAIACPSLFSQDNPMAPKTPPTTGPTSQAVDNRPALQSRNEPYRLERNDVFDLNFVLTPEFDQTVTVRPDGYISLRGEGDVMVLGQTIPEASATISAAYARILDNPTVAINLKDFEKPYFVAGGWVGKPGKYELRGETNLSQAIQVAGGLKDGAKTSNIILFRSTSNGWVEVKNINMKQILAGKDMREDVRLRPGDMFLVPKGAFAKIAPFIPRANVGTYFQPY
jgi:polysaccharide biosynthesis/export protein